mmetsp:Transcript_43944/g.116165  ORF Transcript_43944/g.116165 Transcript_43944/m.116165 type:complete len:217 (+) Transcript_43944:524-1174(+)
MQDSPRTGISTLSKESGQRSFNLFEMTQLISSSLSLVYVSFNNEHTRMRASSSSHRGISAAISLTVRGTVRTIAQAQPGTNSSDTRIDNVLMPGLSTAVMFLGTSRRTWPSSGAAMENTSWPLASRVNDLGHAWALFSLSTRTMRIHSELSSRRHVLSSVRSSSRVVTARSTTRHARRPFGSTTELKGSMARKRHGGHQKHSGFFVYGACWRSKSQ